MVNFRKILLLFFILLLLPVLLYGLAKVTHYFGRASGKSANLVVDLGASFKSSGQVWRNLAQGGEERGADASSRY